MRTVGTIRPLARVLLVILAMACVTNQPAASRPTPPLPAPRSHYEPEIAIWLTSGSVVRRGEDVGVRYRATEDGYVTIARIDTDGRIRVLFPRSPYDDNWVEAGRTYRVSGRGSAAFAVDDQAGVGYVFGVVSPQRLELRRHSRDQGWDYASIGGPVHGDPFLAMRHFAEQLLFHPDDPYDMDFAEYHVDRRYAYPRFICYDCHTSRPYSRWDPYDHACVRYRVVVYDDPYYYPYRRGGRHVVYQRPRYEFKPIPAGERADRAKAIEYRRRGDLADTRRPGAPARDPNLPNGTETPGGSAGGTRPGDDSGTPEDRNRGRRRGQEADGPGNSDNAPGRVRKPVRDTGTGTGPGPGDTGDGNNGHGNDPDHDDDSNPGNGQGNHGQGTSGQGNAGQPGHGNGGNRGPRRPVSAPPAPERAPGQRTEAAREEPRRQEPRRQEPQRQEPRREEPRQAEPRPEARRREEPRREEPRREEPRREEPRREEPRRAERKQAEPRRAEPKAEAPKSSQPVEPKPRRPTG